MKEKPAKEREMIGGCCVCSDERGWDDNKLVYCDGPSCNVAVHQECYGIGKIPQGSWFCRKCESQERNSRVKCELCPSKEGAFKRTDNGGWAHVVCGLYTPEVVFGDAHTMEPIILQKVPREKYGKTCVICEEEKHDVEATQGASIKCARQFCRMHFHVTCAQSLGFLCEEKGPPGSGGRVRFNGYCQVHWPYGELRGMSAPTQAAANASHGNASAPASVNKRKGSTNTPAQHAGTAAAKPPPTPATPSSATKTPRSQLKPTKRKAVTGDEPGGKVTVGDGSTPAPKRVSKQGKKTGRRGSEGKAEKKSRGNTPAPEEEAPAVAAPVDTSPQVETSQAVTSQMVTSESSSPVVVAETATSTASSSTASLTELVHPVQPVANLHSDIAQAMITLSASLGNESGKSVTSQPAAASSTSLVTSSVGSTSSLGPIASAAIVSIANSTSGSSSTKVTTSVHSSTLTSPLATVTVTSSEQCVPAASAERPLLEMPPSLPQSMKDLLQSQWQLGKDFLLGQSASLDVADVIAIMQQLQNDNSNMEAQITELTAKRQHLLSVVSRLKKPQGTSSSTSTVTTPTASTTASSSASQYNRWPRRNSTSYDTSPPTTSSSVHADFAAAKQTSPSPITSPTSASAAAAVAAAAATSLTASSTSTSSYPSSSFSSSPGRRYHGSYGKSRNFGHRSWDRFHSNRSLPHPSTPSQSSYNRTGNTPASNSVGATHNFSPPPMGFPLNLPPFPMPPDFIAAVASGSLPPPPPPAPTAPSDKTGYTSFSTDKSSIAPSPRMPNMYGMQPPAPTWSQNSTDISPTLPNQQSFPPTQSYQSTQQPQSYATMNGDV